LKMVIQRLKKDFCFLTKEDFFKIQENRDSNAV
jgi:hypothetical protein